MSVQIVAVVGAGTMGRGIIQVIAAAGLKVIAIEPQASQQEKAVEAISVSLDRQVRKWTRDNPDVTHPGPSQEELLGRIQWVEELSEAANAHVVIEAVPENEELKCTIMRQLDAACPEDVVLATNTSSISISRIAEATSQPERVVGMHFFNPVPMMQPIEVVRGEKSSPEAIETASELSRQIGKAPYVVADRPGFVVNRILLPLMNEAVIALDEGVADDPETIDALMKAGCNHPMGPLELSDFVGLDIVLSVLEVLHRDLQDDKFRPAKGLQERVAAGHLGRKTGKGFYDY